MSLNRYTQVVEEEFIMEQFRNEYMDLPKGQLVKSESPDFILKLTARKAIGIELTKLHGPAVQKEKTHFPLKINGYHPPELNRENMEYTINAKNDKLPIYRQRGLKQIWLLVTTDLSNSQVSFNLANKLGSWKFSSGFHKIFLFELKARKVFELNIVN